MSTLPRVLAALAALSLGSPCAAQDQAQSAPEPLAHLSRSARQELDKTIAALQTERDRIGAEKLPLAQELTALEERLAKLRTEHDQIARTVDEGNLEIAAIATETKRKQDELAYTSTLLDEYARAFETKVHVSELQYCGEALESAKQAAANPSLELADRFAKQTELVRQALKRSFEVLGGMRFPGVGVGPNGDVAEGTFALVGPVAMFRAKNGEAGLAVAQSGSTRPLVRPLEGALQEGIGELVQQGEGTLPFDPSRGGALAALVARTNLIHVFEKGGPIMWPLLFASVLALGTVLERLFFLMNERRKRDRRAVDTFLSQVENGDLRGAVATSQKTRDFVTRALGYALQHQETSLTNALHYAQGRELKRFRRGIPILDTVITLAPLLGLLGTVTGMMSSFSIIGGDLGAPNAITGGIAEALIATAFGLGIAITALLPFNWLNARLDDASHELESASKQLELLIERRNATQARMRAAASAEDPNAFAVA